jgi:hypothetical protein
MAFEWIRRLFLASPTTMSYSSQQKSEGEKTEKTKAKILQLMIYMTQNCIGLHTKTAAAETNRREKKQRPRALYLWNLFSTVVIIFQRKNLNDALLRRHKLLTMWRRKIHKSNEQNICFKEGTSGDGITWLFRENKLFESFYLNFHMSTQLFGEFSFAWFCCTD